MNNVLRRNLAFIFALIGGILAVFLLEFVAPEEVLSHGLIPRTKQGLFGIVTMPFLHANLAHLLGNLVSLGVLLAFMLVFHSKRLIGDVIAVALLGGLLLWLFGRPAIHIGASGLIYGLAGFMIVAGFAQRRFLEVIAAVAVAILYGNSLFWGLLPFQPGISWDGHLAGAVGGAMFALPLRRRVEGPPPRPDVTQVTVLNSRRAIILS